MSSLEDTESWDAPLLQPSSGGDRPWKPSHVIIDAAGCSHPGYVRSNNEDHFLITRFGRFLECVQSNLPAEELPARHEAGGHALLVADGLGGHAAGEKASKTAVRILLDLVIDTPDWIVRVDESPLKQEVERRAEQRLAQISHSMTDQADEHPELRGFGTTLTAVWGIGQNWFVAHAGDSRAYLFREGLLRRLTRDHTVAQEMVDTGQIDEDEVALHPLRNRLTRLLGDQMQHIIPQIKHFTVADGDTLLLCSDGLTDMIDEGEITELLALKQSATDDSRRLMEAALDAGGGDNVTVIVAYLKCNPSQNA